jgi:lipocalin
MTNFISQYLSTNNLIYYGVPVLAAGLIAYTIYQRPWLPKLKTQPKIDYNRYQGLWYEIALLPNLLEKGLENTNITYTLKNGYLYEVAQALRNGKPIEVVGQNKIDADDHSMLSVKFSKF